MMVILIIVILIAILLPALNYAFKTATQAKARAEIGQLDAAVQSFTARFNVNYIPSQIKLCKFYSDYLNPMTGLPTTQLDKDSITFILKLFPKVTNSYPPAAPTVFGAWNCTVSPTGPPYTFTNNGTGINWSPNWSSYTPGNPLASVTLEGHQALVFFLGGIQTSVTTGSATVYSCSGFSTNYLDPSDPTPTIDRIPPFYEFDSSRLSLVGSTFVSYLDPFSGPGGPKPYLYFSSYKSTNGYNNFPATTFYTAGDNATQGVSPYYLTTKPGPPVTYQYVNPDKYQIISAGADGVFGTGGGPWAPDGSSSTGNAFDDLSNFTPGKLSGGQ
jgi:general secretion pathway protein G